MIIQRLLELKLSHKNEKKILANGGFEYQSSHYKYMVLLHGCWFVCVLLEIIIFNRSIELNSAILWTAVFFVGQVLRLLAIFTLKDRWTTKIMVLPQKALVVEGIYRSIRHPNYLGVVLEIASLPLIHGAYLSAIIFTILNAMLLYVRIKHEEAILYES